MNSDNLRMSEFLKATDLRILFSIKWPLRASKRGPKRYRFEIDWEKLPESLGLVELGLQKC
jgi:hypothetical protein